MVDNVEITSGTGTAVAADNIDDVFYQRIKPVFGVDGDATDVSPGAGMPTSNAYAEYTGSASANNTDLIPAVDARAYGFGTCQLSGTWAGNVNIQGSNDGTTWYTINAASPNQSSLTSAMTGNDLYFFTRFARYVRVRFVSYSSGTANATLELFSSGGWQFTSIKGVSSYGVSLTMNAPLGDALTGTIQTHFSPLMVFNGTNWDRARNVTNVDGSGSTGLLAAGLVAHDAVGAVNRRVRSDAVGNLYMREPPATAAALSSVTSSASTGTLLAANTARRSAIVINESTATLYLAYAATASATAYTQSMAAGSTWEMPMPAYTGAISCIWSAANGAARVTELT